MEDREARKAFKKVKQYCENTNSQQKLTSISMELQKYFEEFNHVVEENQMKKNQLEREYQNQMQECMKELFECTAEKIKNLEESIEERNQKWIIASEKMKLYENLKQNLKKMFHFKLSNF